MRLRRIWGPFESGAELERASGKETKKGQIPRGAKHLKEKVPSGRKTTNERRGKWENLEGRNEI